MISNIIPFVYGMAFLLTGIKIIYSNNKAKKQCTEPVLAVVSDYEVIRRQRGTTYSPVLSFISME